MAGKNRAFFEQKIKELEQMIKVVKEKGQSTDYLEKVLNQYKDKINVNKFNAKKVEIDGIKFDSAREGEFYKFLKNSGFKFERQVIFTLQEPFEIEGEKIQDIRLTVDFVIENEMIVDVKGMITEEFNIKWKMLKNKFRDDYIYRTCVNTTERNIIERDIKILLSKRHK